jgi:hypothetical protein
MSTPTIPKVTDLVQRSLDEHNRGQQASREGHAAEAARLFESARLYADLAEAQGVKTANVIAYLNSDREKWSETDDQVVRSMLGLFALDGSDTEPDPEPEPDEEGAAYAAPVQEPAPAGFDEHDEVDDAPDFGAPDFGGSRAEVARAR